MVATAEPPGQSATCCHPPAVLVMVLLPPFSLPQADAPWDCSSLSALDGGSAARLAVRVAAAAGLGPGMRLMATWGAGEVAVSAAGQAASHRGHA